LADSGSSLQPPWVGQFPADAAAHLGHRVVAELAEVEVIDHDLRVGSKRGVQIAEAHTAGSMANSVAALLCALT
jgi:hypothetical protein